ncbi:hypothetical protein O181_072809 [Austropuccinia psidii MF-1]|uniref:Inositol-pentakisphosphate 2-kinase n=1 Tax=Austropuccinia psidii MF-1 TaxID=1389203 RepID=A0A9Q3IBU9_9BASI|nr:hypothetical protein [Austropuccinia psidii MF-1]
MSSTESVFLSSPSDWRYVAEGSANLVVVYDPSFEKNFFHQNLKNKALRLHKKSVDKTKTHSKTNHNPADQNLTFSSLNPSVQNDLLQSIASDDLNDISFLDFHHEIISRLLEPTHLLQFELVELNPAWFKELIAQVEPSRPAFRRINETIDSNRTQVIMTNNLVGTVGDQSNNQTIAIEIKPKWSFLPQRPSSLDSDISQIKMNFCRTCVFRAVRSTLKTIDSPDQIKNHLTQLNNYYISSNRFCALELFDTANPASLQASLHQLYNEWRLDSNLNLPTTSSRLRPHQKHNNLSVFQHGASENPTSLKLGKSMLDVVATCLKSSHILQDLDQFQRRLDPIDIEGISTLLNTNLQADLNENILKEPIQLTELKEIVTILAEKIPWPEYINIFDLFSCRKKVIMYVLSMAFKDCSIFIRIPVQKSTNGELLPSATAVEEAEIKIIDLDLKPLSRIKKWIKDDKVIFTCFKSLLANLESNEKNSSCSTHTGFPISCQQLCKQHKHSAAGQTLRR